MSFRVVSKQIAKIDVVELCELMALGSKKELQLDSVRVDMKFIMRDCVVKYTPEKYDKITITVNDECNEELTKLYNFLKKDCPELQNFMKESSLGLKLTPEQKQELKKEKISKESCCDFVVDFNHIWKMNGKDYASFKLVQFKKVEKQEIDYFKN